MTITAMRSVTAAGLLLGALAAAPAAAAVAEGKVLGLQGEEQRQTASSTASTDGAETLGRPSGCKYSISDEWRTGATCSSHNGGHFRALANCKDADTGKVTQFTGTWEKHGYSFAYCQGNTRPVAAGIETKVS